MLVQGSVEKRTKDVYGASGGRKLLLFLDDLNMPHMDTYGTQQPIALLKLLLERKVGLSEELLNMSLPRYSIVLQQYVALLACFRRAVQCSLLIKMAAKSQLPLPS